MDLLDFQQQSRMETLSHQYRSGSVLEYSRGWGGGNHKIVNEQLRDKNREGRLLFKYGPANQNFKE